MAPEARRHGGSGWFYVGMAIVGAMTFGGLMEATAVLGAASLPIWFMTLGAATLVLRGPVGKAIARRLTGDLNPPPTAAELPAELYAELDELRARLLDVEERQDFSERLLAQRDPPSAPAE